MLEGFIPLKLSAKNTSSASTTPSTYPLPKNVLMQSRILCLRKKLVATILAPIYILLNVYIFKDI